MEMIEPWQIYCLLELDSLNRVLAVGMALSLIAFTVALICFVSTIEYSNRTDPDDPYHDEYLKYKLSEKATWRSGLLSVLFTVLLALVPSTKDAVLIWAIPRITNGQAQTFAELEKTPNKLAKLLNKELDGWLKEAEEAKE